MSESCKGDVCTSRFTLHNDCSRYQELLRNAGAGEGEEFPTTTSLFSKTRETEDEDDDEDYDLEDSLMQEEAVKGKENPTKCTRLTTQRQDKGKESDGHEELGDGKGSTVVFQHGGGGGSEADQRSTAAVAKTASRIALYMMREEMKETPVESPVQHSHDFFVISSCGVAAKILNKNVKGHSEEEIVNFHGLKVDKQLLPGDYDANSTVMARYALDPEGKSTRHTQKAQWRSSMVPMSLPGWEQIAASCQEEGWSDADIYSLKDFVAFVNNFKTMGASKSDIRGWRSEQATVKRLGVLELLSMAIRHFLVIQVGVVEQMYVGHAHSRPWLLHSFKVVRANEELGSLKEAGKLYQGHGPLPAVQEKRAEGGEMEEMESQEPVQVTEDAAKPPSKGPAGEEAIAGPSGHAQEELGRGKRVIKSRRWSDDTESSGGQVDPEKTLSKSRRGSLDDNIGGEDILINARRKNPQVSSSAFSKADVALLTLLRRLLQKCRERLLRPVRK